jgi:hypothetical protein
VAAVRRADGAPRIERVHHRDRVELGEHHVERGGDDPAAARVLLRKGKVEQRTGGVNSD